MNLTQELVYLETILKEAGQELANFTGKQSLRIEHKEDDSLVTEADLASEKSILTNIERYFPGEQVISEEQHSELLRRKAGELVWVVDPLDGTTNFANGYPFYCVSIARCRVGSDSKLSAVMGGVYDPVRDRCYLAQKSKGASCNGRAIQVRHSKQPRDAFLVTGFSYHKGEQLAEDIRQFLKVAAVSSSIRRDGAAALDLALVAEGIYDAYWETGLKPWDVAAGALLVQEAGGCVVNIGSDQEFDPETESVIAGSVNMVEWLGECLTA